MKLTRINIRRMPGFAGRGPCLESLTSGINVVFGRNGTGKTTLAKSIQGLLWPQKLSDIEYPDIEAQWEESRGTVQAGIEGSRKRFELQSGEAVSFDLPPEHFSSCATITVDDLFLNAGQTEAVLSAEVQKSLAGGFDVRSLLREAKNSKNLQRPNGQALKQAERQVFEEEQKQKLLYHQLSQLKELSERVEELPAVDRHLDAIICEQERRVAKLELERHEKQLAHFSPAISRLFGNELVEAKNLDQELDSITAALAKDKLRYAQLIDEVEELKSQSAGVSRDGIELAREWLSQAERLDAELHHLEAEQARLLSKKQEYAHQGIVIDDQMLASGGFDKAAAQLESFVADYWETQHKVLTLETELSLKKIEEGLPRQDLVDSASNSLQSWLSAENEKNSASSERKILQSLLIFIACLLGGGAIYLATVNSVWWLVLLFFSSFFCFVAFKRMRSLATKNQALYIKQYEQFSLRPIHVWNATEVSSALTELQNLKDRIRTNSDNAIQRERLLVNKRQVESKLAELNKQKGNISAQVGAPIDMTVTSFVRHLEAIRGAALLEVELRGQEALVKRAWQERAKCFQQIAELCGVSISVENIDLVKAKVFVERLRSTLERLSSLQSECAQLKRLIEDNELRENSCRAKRKELFLRVNIDEGDYSKLTELLSQCESYNEARKAMERARGVYEDKVSALPIEAKKYELENDDILGLELNKLNDRRARLEQERTKLIELTGRVEEIKSRHPLEESILNRDHERDVLVLRWEQYAQSALELWWLEEAQAANAGEQDLAVLRRGGGLFSRFTRGAYELETTLSETGELEFKARNTETGKLLLLSELSRGTYTQLHLAIRIAFLEANERKEKLPLVLDEALSSSDTKRFVAVAEALLEIAKDGRQVIYLTCQESDVVLWKQIAAKSDSSSVSFCSINSNDGYENGLNMFLEAREALPSPNGHNLRAYMELLGIPRPDVWEGKGKVHLGYLVDDPQTLYCLLSAGIERVGAFLNLVRLDGGRSLLAEQNTRARLVAKARLVEEFFDAWQIGRGKRLTPEVLKDACKTKSLDAIIQKAQELNWNTSALIDEIDPNSKKAISGLRKNVFDDLKLYLENNGYLASEDMLSSEQLRARVLAAYGNLGAQAGIGLGEVGELTDWLLRL